MTTQLQRVLADETLDVPGELPGLLAQQIRPPFSLMNRNLYFANFNQALLSGMFLDGSILDWADFVGILAWHSRWVRASLRNANLTGAKLFAADMQNADLRRAKLVYADLSFADLRFSDLREADLTSAHVLGARFEEALYSSGTKLPFTEERAHALGLRKVESNEL